MSEKRPEYGDDPGRSRRDGARRRDPGGARGDRGGAGDSAAKSRSDASRPATSRAGASRVGNARAGEPSRQRARDGASPRPARDGASPRPARDGTRSGPWGDAPPKPRHDDPAIPEDVKPGDLDRGARAELKALTKENADFAAQHLVLAGRLIDSDPALAHRHALAAARRAGRIAVVRETVGITAYATGDFALALRELRTYRRISGRDDQLPLMVDSERGIGRPERALELGRSVPRGTLEPAVQVGLAIAMSGARLDLGQPDAALEELRIPQLDPERAHPWSPALFDAYATVLSDLGREDEAEQWWERSDRALVALERAATPEAEEIVEVIEEERVDGADEG